MGSIRSSSKCPADMGALPHSSTSTLENSVGEVLMTMQLTQQTGEYEGTRGFLGHGRWGTGFEDLLARSIYHQKVESR